MDVEIGNKFHAPQETTSYAECQQAKKNANYRMAEEQPFTLFTNIVTFSGPRVLPVKAIPDDPCQGGN
jgi:hypothetical protein